MFCVCLSGQRVTVVGFDAATGISVDWLYLLYITAFSHFKMWHFKRIPLLNNNHRFVRYFWRYCSLSVLQRSLLLITDPTSIYSIIHRNRNASTFRCHVSQADVTFRNSVAAKLVSVSYNWQCVLHSTSWHRPVLDLPGHLALILLTGAGGQCSWSQLWISQ